MKIVTNIESSKAAGVDKLSGRFLKCLSFLTDKVLKGFDKDLLTEMILTDLKKTFDTIGHEIRYKT